MSGTEAEAPAVPAKLDPESLVLRGRAGRPIRFKRGLVIGLGALGATALSGIAWYALTPAARQHPDPGGEQSQITTATPSDALSGLPATYGIAPRLGPPLPGDLGKPILDHQREGLGPPATAPVPGPSAADDAETRALAARKTARESALLVDAGVRPQANEVRAKNPQSDRVAPGGATAPSAPTDAGAAPVRAAKSTLVAASAPGPSVNPYRVEKPASPNLLSAGSVIAASLITGIRSDVPGLVTAQVTENVYDSATGAILLIPQGARLIGSYDSVVAFGQKRALVVWQRIVLQDGSSLRIDNVPATDPAGYSGLADRVDFHTWSLLKGVVLSTLLGIGPELALSGDSDLVQAIRLSTAGNVSRAGDQLVSRNLDVPPTITIRPGARVRLVVHHDLILQPFHP